VRAAQGGQRVAALSVLLRRHYICCHSRRLLLILQLGIRTESLATLHWSRELFHFSFAFFAFYYDISSELVSVGRHVLHMESFSVFRSIMGFMPGLSVVRVPWFKLELRAVSGRDSEANTLLTGSLDRRLSLFIFISPDLSPYSRVQTSSIELYLSRNL